MIKSIPRRVFSYFSEVKNEVSKVAWPTQKSVLVYSALVFACCIVLALYSGVLDFGLTELLDFLLAR